MNTPKVIKLIDLIDDFEPDSIEDLAIQEIKNHVLYQDKVIEGLRSRKNTYFAVIEFVATADPETETFKEALDQLREAYKNSKHFTD